MNSTMGLFLFIKKSFRPFFDLFLRCGHSEWGLLLRKACNLCKAGQSDVALPMMKKALTIAENNMGPDHPEIAYCLIGLSDLYLANGQYAQAEPLLNRTLSIRENAFGPDHPDVSTILYNLVELCRTTDREGDTPNLKNVRPLFEP